MGKVQNISLLLVRLLESLRVTPNLLKTCKSVVAELCRRVFQARCYFCANARCSAQCAVERADFLAHVKRPLQVVPFLEETVSSWTSSFKHSPFFLDYDIANIQSHCSVHYYYILRRNPWGLFRHTRNKSHNAFVLEVCAQHQVVAFLHACEQIKIGTISTKWF